VYRATCERLLRGAEDTTGLSQAMPATATAVSLASSVRLCVCMSVKLVLVAKALGPNTIGYYLARTLMWHLVILLDVSPSPLPSGRTDLDIETPAVIICVAWTRVGNN